MASRTLTEYLELSITSPTGNTTITQRLAEFKPGAFRLWPVYEYGALERNADNSPVENGPTENQHYRISGDTYIDFETEQNLELIQQIHAAHLREKTGNQGISASYNYQQIVEFGARTRPVSATTTETLIGTEARSYFPVFKVKFATFEVGPVFHGNRFLKEFRFELVELDRFSP